jgi:hypothetical protein
MDFFWIRAKLPPAANDRQLRRGCQTGKAKKVVYETKEILCLGRLVEYILLFKRRADVESIAPRTSIVFPLRRIKLER